MNGDGFDDILIGARGNAEGGSYAGQTYLLLGKASGWARGVGLEQADASFIGEEDGDHSVESISGAGDVNGDGYDDILIGARGNDEGGNNAGQTYLVFGRSTGWSMDMDLSSANASFIGDAGGDNAGDSVSGAGDVNGDGFDDILIGSPENDKGGSRAGQTYLIFGKALGWCLDNNLSFSDASFLGATITLSGDSVCGIGNLNGDGFDDILIGAYQNNGGSMDYLVYGKSSGWELDTLLSLSDASFIGDATGDSSVNSISDAGDVNGDGIDDIIIGVRYDDEGGEDAGQTFLIPGGGGYSEPLEIYDFSVRNEIGDKVNRADIDQELLIEIIGKDSDSTRIDRARVNISFSKSIPNQITKSLMETGANTGVYRGEFMVPARAVYYEKMRFSAYKDQNKYHNVVVDYRFRPSSVTSIGVYPGAGSSSLVDKLDLGQTGFFKCVGLDTNPATIDKSFVNLSSDKNSSYLPMIILTETGQSTGIYSASFTVPDTMEYFENITLTSSETPTITAKFMVHTPVQIRARSQYQTAKEDEEYRVGFYNFGYNTATWTLNTDAYWLSWDDTNLELHGTARNNDVGKYLWNVILMIKDSYDNTHSLEFPLSVWNTPPEILTEPIIECLEKEEYYLDLNSDDDDQGEIGWYLYSVCPFLTIEKDTGILKGTPIEGDEGEYLVNVQVQDGKGGSDALIFNLTVRGQNDRPTITSIDVRQIEQDTPFRRDYEVFDPDEGDTHQWTLRTDADWLSMENETGVLLGTPDGFEVGDWAVNITVTDSGGLNDSREFTLKVLDKKDKPIWIDIPEDIELLHGTDYYFDANATDPDIGNILIYSIETETECDMRINSKTGDIGWTANYRCMPKSGGGIQVTLKVSDGELFSIHEFVIDVLPTDPPTAELVSPLKGARTPSDKTDLEWSGTDPEDETLTFTLYLADSESYVSAKRAENILDDGITSSNYTVTGLTQGKTYYWMVLPDDGCSCGTCTNGVFSFRVNNRPILKQVEGQNTETGTEFTLKLEGSDNDQDDKLTYEILSGPSGMTVRSETGMIVWTPKDSQVGMQKVRAKVTDGYEFVERSFDVEVAEGSNANLGLIIGIVVGLLVLIIAILLIYIFVIKGKSTEEEEDEETKRIQEEMEQHQKELEWEETHTKPSDHQVVSDVPLSATEAHAHDRDTKPKTYDELYGSKIPEE
ncbi:MAG: putative Ig domain-containing protein [Candidatus Thermoplasmatota archaeon]|nr:putative Ig domain-containing protein [Candidatus Thermoplasmatota archaeon]